MLGTLGLVLLTGPFITLPTAAVADPALMALGSDPAQLRLFCYSTRCGDEEWQRAAARLGDHLTFDSKRGGQLSLPGSGPWIGLSAPARPRDAKASYANDWRIGTRYHLQALRNGPTQLGVQLGAAYRLAPLHDDGINLSGPVLRGELDLGYQITERARWNQTIQFETGQGVTFVKQSVGLDVALWPFWTLEGDFQIRHNDAGVTGTESAESSLQLRRRF
ncbi:MULTISPECIES: DUF481 domain-containing protein [unclassified Lysobacter]